MFVIELAHESWRNKQFFCAAVFSSSNDQAQTRTVTLSLQSKVFLLFCAIQLLIDFESMARFVFQMRKFKFSLICTWINMKLGKNLFAKLHWMCNDSITIIKCVINDWFTSIQCVWLQKIFAFRVSLHMLSCMFFFAAIKQTTKQRRWNACDMEHRYTATLPHTL